MYVNKTYMPNQKPYYVFLFYNLLKHNANKFFQKFLSQKFGWRIFFTVSLQSALERRGAVVVKKN